MAAQVRSPRLEGGRCGTAVDPRRNSAVRSFSARHKQRHLRIRVPHRRDADKPEMRNAFSKFAPRSYDDYLAASRRRAERSLLQSNYGRQHGVERPATSAEDDKVLVHALLGSGIPLQNVVDLDQRKLPDPVLCDTVVGLHHVIASLPDQATRLRLWRDALGSMVSQ